MRLWTVQPVSFWRRLQKTGKICGQRQSVIRCWGKDSHFLESYDWLRSQLPDHIPRYQGQYPVWFWTERPDLRTLRHYPPNQVLLEVEIPDHLLALSHFEAWHCVLNNTFLPRSRRDEREFDRLLHEHGPNHPPLISRKRRSWNLIFDLALAPNKWPYWRSSTPPRLQAVAEFLRLPQVQKVTFFNKTT